MLNLKHVASNMTAAVSVVEDVINIAFFVFQFDRYNGQSVHTQFDSVCDWFLDNTTRVF